MQVVTVNASKKYDVKIGTGFIEKIGDHIAPLMSGKKVMVVSDDNVFPLYGEKAVKSLSEATSEDVNKLAGQNGKIYDNAAAATAAGTTAVAKIIYVGSSTGSSSPYTHGLALALADESKTTWADAQTTCDGKNSSVPVTGASWMLPSKAQWETMISAAGSHTALRDGFNSVGGTNIQKDYYWSSTSSNTSQAQAISFNWGFFGASNKTGNCVVRACLVF